MALDSPNSFSRRLGQKLALCVRHRQRSVFFTTRGLPASEVSKVS